MLRLYELSDQTDLPIHKLLQAADRLSMGKLSHLSPITEEQRKALLAETSPLWGRLLELEARVQELENR